LNRTDRLMGILLELQARGDLRAEDLAGTFEVSVRTIYRDVGALSETGVPIFVYALRDAQEILCWLLPWGRSVEVLSPDWLRARIAEEAQAIAARHATAAAMSCAAPIPAT
jgi:predicted DNA-binding transcriptional regulator YafY